MARHVFAGKSIYPNHFVRIVCGGVLALGMMSSSAFANALHGYCFSPTPVCSDNGTNTPTSTNPPNFGFAYSSQGTAAGDYLLAFLVPNMQDPSNIVVSGGANGSVTASLHSTNAWTSGALAAYLGISAKPANPFGAFGSPTSGYYVYTADLGKNTLAQESSTGNVPTPGPDLSLSASLPVDSYIVAFLGTSTGKYIATANSGAILETGQPTTTSVPEPGSLVLLGTSLAMLGLAIRKRARTG